MKYQEKLSEWVSMYLKHIREVSIEKHAEEEEGYKFRSVQCFQDNFDIEAIDIAGNLEKSILNNNLVVGAQYWPRKMLIIYAQDYPKETRDALKNLFNESKDIYTRITETFGLFNDINEMRNTKLGSSPKANTYIGLRFLSLLLGYRFPEKYNALKPAEWKVFARFINPEFSIPKHTSPGEQYKMYLEYIEPLRQYLKTRDDIGEIRNRLVRGLSFRDEECYWMTQDVIYITSRVLANTKAREVVVTDCGEQGENTEDFFYKGGEDVSDGESTGFPLEKHLEEYIVNNWENINFGEDLILYKDEDGAPGQQYTTDVGIIDILAKDKDDNFVVIELKRARSGYVVVGQVLNYMGWIQKNMSQGNQKVRGMIIVGRADKTLQHALMPVSDKILLKEYRVSMKLIDSK